MDALGAIRPLLLLALLLAAVLALLAGKALRGRVSPAERERRRRMDVNARGRPGEATITDATDEVLYYCYTVRGVHYATSQDVSALRHLLPADPASLAGPVTAKYSPENPANSIVLCENWSGLRESPSPSFSISVNDAKGE